MKFKQILIHFHSTLDYVFIFLIKWYYSLKKLQGVVSQNCQGNRSTKVIVNLKKKIEQKTLCIVFKSFGKNK